MGHYAFLNKNSTVIRVLVLDDSGYPQGFPSWEDYYSELLGEECKRTCPDTLENKHLDGGTPFRGNYAGIGFSYEEIYDAFIPPQPHPSWDFNDDTYSWDPPKPYPEDGGMYYWNEKRQAWEPIINV